jgi:large subunit ribosomal protein L21
MEKTKKQENIAIIETGGKQYIVSAGDVLNVEKLGDDLKEGSKVEFEQVLLVDDGSKTDIGTPYLSKKVTAEFIENGRGKKIDAVRFRSKSRYHRRYGHRQPYSRVKITKIG